MKSCDFYCKRHILAWIHVDWAILRENRLRGLTSRAVGEKSQKVTWGSHRNDVSLLTQGLRYRAACDYCWKCCNRPSLHHIGWHMSVLRHVSSTGPMCCPMCHVVLHWLTEPQTAMHQYSYTVSQKNPPPRGYLNFFSFFSQTVKNF